MIVPFCLKLSVSYDYCPYTKQPVVVNNISVSRTDTQKCLGVQIDEKLSWDNHIYMICKKASAGVGAMRRIKPFVPVDTLEKV